MKPPRPRCHSLRSVRRPLCHVKTRKRPGTFAEAVKFEKKTTTPKLSRLKPHSSPRRRHSFDKNAQSLGHGERLSREIGTSPQEGSSQFGEWRRLPHTLLSRPGAHYTSGVCACVCLRVSATSGRAARPLMSHLSVCQAPNVCFSAQRRRNITKSRVLPHEVSAQRHLPSSSRHSENGSKMRRTIKRDVLAVSVENKQIFDLQTLAFGGFFCFFFWSVRIWKSTQFLSVCCFYFGGAHSQRHRVHFLFSVLLRFKYLAAIPGIITHWRASGT